MMGVPWPMMKTVITIRTETAEKATTRRARRTSRSLRSSRLPRVLAVFGRSSMAFRPSSPDREEALLGDQRLALVGEHEVDELFGQSGRRLPGQEQERPDEPVALVADMVVRGLDPVKGQGPDLVVDQAERDEADRGRVVGHELADGVVRN